MPQPVEPVVDAGVKAIAKARAAVLMEVSWVLGQNTVLPLEISYKYIFTSVSYRAQRQRPQLFIFPPKVKKGKSLSKRAPL